MAELRGKFSPTPFGAVEVGSYFPYIGAMSATPNPHTVDRIIEALGGADAAARRLGVGTEALRKWRQARSIPARHWPAIIAGTGLGLADMPGAETAAAAKETTKAMPHSTSAGPTPAADPAATPPGATAALVLADGAVFWGRGFGAHTPGTEPAEICFNTGMTGYQETLTDPSYAGQIITFTFPHIGNVGTNGEDIEATTIAARGLVVKQDITEPSNWRAAPAPGRLAARAGHRPASPAWTPGR